MPITPMMASPTAMIFSPNSGLMDKPAAVRNAMMPRQVDASLSLSMIYATMLSSLFGWYYDRLRLRHNMHARLHDDRVDNCGCTCRIADPRCWPSRCRRVSNHPELARCIISDLVVVVVGRATTHCSCHGIY